MPIVEFVSKNKKNYSTFAPLLIIGLVSVIVLSVTFYFFYFIRNKIYDENRNTLSSLAILRSEEISNFKDEQIRETFSLFSNKSFTAQINEFSKHPENTALKKESLDWLLSHYDSRNYKSIHIVTSDNRTILSYPAGSETDAYHLPSYDSLTFLDFVIDRECKEYKLGIYLPVYTNAGKREKSASVIFIIDLFSKFYPLVESFPFKTESGEFILVKRDQDSVRFLSPLRFNKAAPYTLSLSIHRSELPAAKAIKGTRGYFEGKDYRGVNVLSYICEIKGTPWFLIAKMDTNEVFKNLYVYTGLLIAVILAVFISAGTATYSVILRQRENEKRFKAGSFNAILKLNRVYNILSKSNSSMIKAESAAELLSNVVKIATGEGQYALCTVGLYSDDLQYITLEAYSSANIQSQSGKFSVKVSYFPKSHPISRVARYGKSIIYNTIPEEVHRINRRFSKDAAEFKSLAAFPIKIDKKVAGIIAFGSKTADNFKEEEIDLLSELSADLSYALRHFSIVQRERAFQKRLANRTALMRAVINGTHSVLIFSVDSSYRYLMFNENHKQEMKRVYNADIKIGESILSYINIPALVPVIKSIIDRSLEGESFTDVQPQPNTAAYYHFHWNPVIRKGKIIGASCFIINITERIEAEKRIVDSEEKYKLLFSSNPSPMMVYDLNTYRYIEVNDAAVNKYGYSRDEFLSMTLEDIRPASELKRLRENLQSERPVLQHSGYWQHMLKDGTIIVVEIVSHLIKYGGKDAVLVMAIDRTKEVQNERQLRKSEETLRLAIKAARIGIYDFDLSTGKARVNDEYALMLGYKPESFSESYRRWIKSMHPMDHKKTINLYQDYLAGKIESYQVTFRLKTFNNSWKWILSTGKFIEYDENGNPLRMLGTHLDITKQKDNEAKLSLQSQMLEQVSHAVCVISCEDSIIYSNAKLTELCQWESEEFLGMIAWDILAAHQHSAFLRNILIKVYSGDNWSGEMMINRKDDLQFIADVVITPFKDEEGLILGAIMTIEDITLQKENLQQIRNLSRAVEQSPASIIITDTSGDIIYANKKAMEATGYSASEIIGHNPRIFSSHELPESEYINLWKTILAGNEWKGEFHNKRKDGTLFWESASISPILDDAGNIQYFLGIKEDITERKQMLNQLIEARNKAEESNAIKTSFLANISHELRTPLIAILGFSEMLSDEITDQDLLHFVKGIQTGGNRLLKSVDLLMHFTSIARKDISTDLSAVSLSGTLTPIIDSHKDEILAKGLRLSYNIDSGLSVYTDPKILAEAFEHILNNAYRFTFEGFINISAETDSDETRIIVADSGIGIPVDKQQIIFEEFRQVSEGFGRSFEGTGLGLTLAKRFMEMMGGKISVNSYPGKGSTFILHLQNKKGS